MRWILMVAILTGCAHRAPAQFLGERPPAGCEPAALDKAEPDDKEMRRCIFWYAERLQAELYAKEYQDARIAGYVARVGQRIVRASGLTERITFRVMDDPDPKAEAWAGGAVRVTRGALARLRSEAELAALLGHEIGHVIAAHTDGQNRSHRDARDDEIQADELAVRLTARAGYDATAVEVMLRAIAVGNPATCTDDERDHPCMTERIARVRALAGASHGELGAERFRTAVAGLVTNPIDPLRVSAVGGALVFGHARLAFAPPDAGEVQTVDGYGGVALADEVIVVVPVSIAFARALRRKPPDGTALHVGKHGALWIVVGDGAAASRRATELLRWVRSPRPDELATLHPTFYDPHAPRRLWPD